LGIGEGKGVRSKTLRGDRFPDNFHVIQPLPLSNIPFFSIYLTPCVPLSFEGEGEEIERGASPLLDSP